MTSWIGPDQHWALLAVLLAAGAAGILGERTRWGARISGAVLAMLATFVLSNARIIPVAAPLYDVVWTYVLPLAIPLLLFRANLVRILREAGPTLAAFALGAVGTVIGSVLAFRLVPLGDESAKLAGIFCATYVGGSMNYYATANVLELESGTLLTAGVAADNLAMVLYFLVLFTLPSWARLRRRYPIRTAGIDEQSAGQTAPTSRMPDLPRLSLALAISATACAIGFAVESWTGYRGIGILVLTALVVAMATCWPPLATRLEGADVVGTFLMQIFFATIGATASLWEVFRVGPLLLVFAGTILTMHLGTILLGGWLLRLDLREIVVASNANMGGPTTAAAMAAARRWHGLVTPAILVGTLGYASATFVGVFLGRLLIP